MQFLKICKIYTFCNNFSQKIPLILHIKATIYPLFSFFILYFHLKWANIRPRKPKRNCKNARWHKTRHMFLQFHIFYTDYTWQILVKCVNHILRMECTTWAKATLKLMRSVLHRLMRHFQNGNPSSLTHQETDNRPLGHLVQYSG